MRGVEVAQRAISLASENGNRGVLKPLAIFATQVIFEAAAAGAEQAQPVPASCAGVSPQGCDISGGNNSEIKILCQVMGDAVSGVDPSGAHGASLSLLFSEHEVIDKQRAIRIGE